MERLLAALDKGLTQLEARMEMAQGAEGVPMSAADLERDARALNGLTGLLAKICELEDEARKRGETATGEAMEAAEDAEAFRNDLALRLQRLNQAWDPR